MPYSFTVKTFLVNCQLTSFYLFDLTSFQFGHESDENYPKQIISSECEHFVLYERNRFEADLAKADETEQPQKTDSEPKETE